MSKSLVRIILWSGLLVGTLDAVAAIINYCIPTVRNPVRIFQYIASGVFGMNAFSDGMLMPILGLIFHYFISTFWTLLFFLLYPKINWLGKSWIISGLGYGVFVWLAMNLVVLKLRRSTIPLQPDAGCDWDGYPDACGRPAHFIPCTEILFGGNLKFENLKSEFGYFEH